MFKYILIGFGISVFGVAPFFIFQSPPQINEELIVPEIAIEYPSEYNYIQSINDCGPFSVAAVVRALKQEPVSSKIFVDTMKWRLENDYTFPWGLEKQLKENGINIQTPNLGKLSDEDRIKYLREQLSLKRPIILLIEQDVYQHYITLLGYTLATDEFYIYNSFYDQGKGNLTVDNNNLLPGNMNMTSEDLLDSWSKGGMYGIYNWYALVNSIDNE